MLKIRSYFVLSSFLCALVISSTTALISTSSLYAQDAYSSLSPAAQAIVDAINQARSNAGLAPLQVNPLLNLAAQSHANDVGSIRMFGHSGSDGSNVRFRVRRTGYNSDWAGENWILTSTPGDAMRWWLSDPPHAENILHANYTEIGVGEYQDSATGLTFWVTDFARSPGGSAPVVQAGITGPSSVEPVVHSVPPEGLDYTVQSGDTLLVIGLRHGLDWETIASANGLTGRSILQIGQVLHIPGGGAVGGGESQVEIAHYIHTNYAASYTIKAGDTLVGVANRYGVTWQELASVNSLGEWSVLQIGQTIKVPGKSEEAPQTGVFVAAAQDAVVDQSVLYTVKEGDTIFVIAIRNHLDWLELLRLNGLTEDSILQPGQQIRLK